MKNLILFVLLGMILLPATAQHNSRYDSELVLRLQDNTMFTVIFDHQVYDAPSSVFRINQLEPGMHSLIVKQRRGGRYGSHVDILYRGNIRIPRRTRVIAEVGYHNNLRIIEEIAIHGNGYNDGGYNGGACGTGGYYTKPPLDFPRLQNTLNNASFESDRLTIAKQAVATHSVLADEIFLIMEMFSFESTKLDFAKFAYPHCEDKENYYRVNDAFSFSSSIHELNNYINGYGRRGGNYHYYNYGR